MTNADVIKSEQSGLVSALSAYLNCPCHLFTPLSDDAPLWDRYVAASRRGKEEGFTPVLISVDKILWECMCENIDAQSHGSGFTLDPAAAKAFRERLLGAQDLPDGEACLGDLLKELRENWKEDGSEWNDEAFGAVEGGELIDKCIGYWDYQTRMTQRVILAEIPAKEPWEIFAWLPMGGWNECPDERSMMSIAKYWYETYGAIPAAVSHDTLEFYLEKPVKEERAARKLALEHYAFCPDRVEQGGEGATVGSLADSLTMSNVWYFWWD